MLNFTVLPRFLLRCCCTFLLLPGLLGSAPAVAQSADTLLIGWLGGTDNDAWAGARQGILEANAQGRFLGVNYELHTVTDANDALTAGVIVVVADARPVRLRRIAATLGDTAVINVAADDDDLRSDCAPNLLHTLPSTAMLDDAVQQWQRKHPHSGATARAWHHDFRKYAAAQLNRRYTETFKRPMTDAAWAGWAAVKLVADTVARGAPRNGPGLLQALKTDLAFDGQKGSDMSFRNTGQLRQPLLLVEGDKIVGEAPVRGIVAVTNLDTLGLADCLK